VVDVLMTRRNEIRARLCKPAFNLWENKLTNEPKQGSMPAEVTQQYNFANYFG
jgi:hypothetical protein